MATALNEPIIADGIRNTNYFQGRVLSAEDLATDQIADRRHRAQLGQAIGPGIVHGLEARIETAGPSPVVSVERGLALNGDGDTIELRARVSLALLGDPGRPTDRADGVFGPCSDAGPRVDLSGNGAYLLLLSPAQGYRERAPLSGLDDNGIAGSCGARYLVEGATLRLVPLPLAGRSDIAPEFNDIAALDDPASVAGTEEVLQVVSRFRNRLAHLCLTDAAASGHAAALRAGAPEVFDADPTLLDELRQSDTPSLRSCDVPLAVLYLDLFGLRFLDRWAARRLARPRLAATTLSLFPDHGLERLLQFSEQLDDVLAATGSIASVRIGDYVRHVPPAGWFPAQGSGVAGFSPSQFLTPYTRGVVGRMSAGQLAERLDTSLRHNAVDLQSGSCLLTYDLDENTQALVTGQAGRRLRFFMSTAINGPLDRGALALALEGLWQSSRGLARRLDEITLPITSPATERAFRDAREAVTDTANRYAAVALARGLDEPDTLRAMSTLLELQRTLAARMGDIRFQSSGQGTLFVVFFLTIAVNQFVAGLLQRLNGALPVTGAPGLAQAIAAADSCAAIEAQDDINAFIASFSGQSGASGPADLSFIGSPQGQIVVPGGAAFAHVYEISNGTDRLLTFQLEASADAPDGDWSSAVTLSDMSGATITSLPVNSGASGRFTVAVAAPANAVEGQTAILAVRAVSPPPDLRDLSVDPLPLLVGDSGGDPVEQTIRIPEPATPQLQQIFTPGEARGLSFTLLYQAENGPDDTGFDVAVVFEDPVSGWLVSIDGLQGTPEGPAGQFVHQIQLSSGARRVVAVNLRAPTAPVPPVRIRLVVTSRDLDLETQISATSPPNGEVFTLAVANPA